MTTLARTLVMVIVMAGCGGNPAMPDAPDEMAMLAATDASGAPLTSIDVPLTLVGQAASVGVVVHNTGTAETGAISISIGGANAGDLAIDAARTTCAATSLAPGATCTVELVFHAAAAGDRTATLTIASPAGGTLELGITAHGGVPDLQLAPTVELGNVEVGSAAQVSVVLRNAGTFAAPIDAITVSSTGFSAGVFSLGATTCGASLGAHAMCTIDVVASPRDMAPIPFAGTLVVASSGVDHTAALTARGAHRVKILKSGTVTGTVTLTEVVAQPTSDTCGDTCEILTPYAILLTQTPDPGAEFLSWSLPDSGAGDCGMNPTCFVGKELTPTTVTATWVPAGSTQLHIAIVGGSGGLRIVSGGVTTTCLGECTTFVSPGPVTLTVEGTAPAIGFSGACTSSGTQCTYTQGAGLSDVTVTLDNPNAVWTYLPGNGTDVRSAAFDGSGDLIITT
ncbi:MAG TPA: choice-of-anchor D domain-containing protein, partial [Kofleriaceae bacterium]